MVEVVRSTTEDHVSSVLARYELLDFANKDQSKRIRPYEHCLNCFVVVVGEISYSSLGLLSHRKEIKCAFRFSAESGLQSWGSLERRVSEFFFFLFW